MCLQLPTKIQDSLSSVNETLSGLVSDVAFLKAGARLVTPEPTNCHASNPCKDDIQVPGPSNIAHDSHSDRSIVSIEEFIVDNDEHNTEDLNSTLLTNQQSSLMHQ